MSMSAELTKMHLFAEDMAELLPTAAADEDIAYEFTTPRDTHGGDGRSGLMWGLVLRLVSQGWSFSYDPRDDYAREGEPQDELVKAFGHKTGTPADGVTQTNYYPRKHVCNDGCVRANTDRAGEVIFDLTTFDSDTLHRAHVALTTMVEHDYATELVDVLLNAGLLIRERVPEDTVHVPADPASTPGDEFRGDGAWQGADPGGEETFFIEELERLMRIAGTQGKHLSDDDKRFYSDHPLSDLPYSHKGAVLEWLKGTGR